MMSAAACAASVALATAMPIWALARAGASLTPSPVMPTTLPWPWRTATTSCLSLGITWAKPSALVIRSSRAALAGQSAVFEWMLTPSSTWRASSLAMLRWSPVIILTSTDAYLIFLIVSAVSMRGGSMMGSVPAYFIGPSLTETHTAIVL